jgi:hypothetical protein
MFQAAINRAAAPAVKASAHYKHVRSAWLEDQHWAIAD